MVGGLSACLSVCLSVCTPVCLYRGAVWSPPRIGHQFKQRRHSIVADQPRHRWLTSKVASHVTLEPAGGAFPRENGTVTEQPIRVTFLWDESDQNQLRDLLDLFPARHKSTARHSMRCLMPWHLARSDAAWERPVLTGVQNRAFSALRTPSKASCS